MQNVPRRAMPENGATRSTIPWERKGNIGFWAAFLGTFKEVLFETSSFFRRMPTNGDMKAPLLFAVIGGTASIWTSLAVQWLLKIMLFTFASDLPDSYVKLAAIVTVLLAAATPVVLACLVLVGSAVLHILLVLLKGAPRRFETSFRVFCYSLGVMGWLVVPCCGALVVLPWGIVSLIIGMKYAHDIAWWKAALSVLLAAFLAGGCIALVVNATRLPASKGQSGLEREFLCFSRSTRVTKHQAPPSRFKSATRPNMLPTVNGVTVCNSMFYNKLSLAPRRCHAKRAPGEGEGHLHEPRILDCTETGYFLLDTHRILS
jgi:hypothetical protein